jgi:uncharacterized RDD family membrane protein YckC
VSDLDRDLNRARDRARDRERDSILALDNIRLDLPVAGVGGRCLAGLVDGVLLAVLALLWLLLWIAIAGWGARGWGIAVAVAGVFLLEWGYFAGMEIATGGRTLGKMALGLRVVAAEGAAAGAGALLVRNLVRDVDYLVGVPLMAWDPLARRLGDRLGGTVVVHDRPRHPAPLCGRVPDGWSPREVAIAESFLARAPQLGDPAARDAMARQLLARVERDAPGFVAGLDRGDPVRALRLALAVEEG